MGDNRLQPMVAVIDGLPQVVSGVYSQLGEQVQLTVEGRGGQHLVTLVGNPVSLGALVAALADALDTSLGAGGEVVVIRKDLAWPVPLDDG